MYSRTTICALLLLFFAGQASTATHDEELARVRGRVTTLWGQPIEGVELSFFQLEGIQGNSPTEKLISRAITNKDGEYELRALPLGQYRVDVLSRGYGHTEIWRFYLSRGAKRVLDIGVPMGIIHHVSQMEVRGTVRTTMNKTVPEVTVTLINAYNPSESDQVRTDAKGRYSLRLIQEGDFLLQVSKPGYRVAATTISLRSGEHKTADLLLIPRQPRRH